MTFINHEDKLFYLYRKVKKRFLKINSNEEINLLNAYWFCDKVLSKFEDNEEVLYFVREISEAEVEI